MDAQLQVY